MPPTSARGLDTATELRQQFRQRFGTAPQLFRAPGRVNLIGEHTDYNDGLVMPAAIDLHTWVAAAVRAGDKLVVRSHDFDEQIELDPNAMQPRRHWSDYVAGVASQLRTAGVPLPGVALLIRGEVPLGAGLSSSAALEVAAALALLHLAGRSMDPLEIALLCQRAENQFVGARCGIMDQFIACHARARHALLLDCRSLAYRLLPLPQNVSLVVCNTMVKHAVAGVEYNQRREQCEAGVRFLARKRPHVRALRDVTMEELDAYGRELPPLIQRRCRHVITENARVQQAAAALEAGDLELLGTFMAESHRSLRQDYDVSSPELDLMVDLASPISGVVGARMTGGGFGGCTINLVRDDSVAAFRAHIEQRYQQVTGEKPEIYVAQAAGAADQIG